MTSSKPTRTAPVSRCVVFLSVTQAASAHALTERLAPPSLLRPLSSLSQMESAHLLHLSHLSPKIRAAACHMVFADRTGGAFIDPAVVEELEPKVGRACLDALIGWDVEHEHPERGAVWEM